MRRALIEDGRIAALFDCDEDALDGLAHASESSTVRDVDDDARIGDPIES